MVVRQLAFLFLIAALMPLSSFAADAEQEANAVTVATEAAKSDPADTFAHDLSTQAVEVVNNRAAYVGAANELMAADKVQQVQRKQEASFQSLLQAATSYDADAMNAAAVKYGLKPESKQLQAAKGGAAPTFRYRLHI